MAMVRRWAAVALISSAVVLSVPQSVSAQQQPQVTDDTTLKVLLELKEQINALQGTIRDLRRETSQYHAETEQLRAELKAALSQIQPVAETSAPADSNSRRPETSDDERVAQLQEDYELLSRKVEDQYQAKVESASKYRVRLSGIALLNLFENRGAVDNQDVPGIAISSVGRAGGSFGGTLRQSQVGLDVFGPTWQGARIRGNLQFDFGGGFPNTENGVTAGLVRLRTAVLRLDWARTSIVGGQDAPFFSPLSPTSLASLIQPALAYSGNLWTWLPQLRVEHRLSIPGGSGLSVQAGILDPLTGQAPPNQFYRVPQAGEASRQPAYATRVAWTSAARNDRQVSFGTGGFYSRQNWGIGHAVDAWAATADASVPLGQFLTVTGEFYRGRGIGGLGGALGNSVVSYGPPSLPNAPVDGLNAIGGWSQLKWQATPRLEFNAAAGQDNPFANQIRESAQSGSTSYSGTVRNRTALTNFIYHPRSDLLFSVEYRRIQSYKLAGSTRDADQVNVAMGVLF